MIKNGLRTIDKLCLFVFACYYFLPNKITHLNTDTPQIMINLSKKTKIKINGVTYNISHPRQLFVISPKYEKEIQNWFNLEGETFLDLGANIGKYSLMMASRFKNVHSFEPINETANILNNNIHNNDLQNVTLHRLAAWDKETELVFHLKNNPNNNSACMTKNSIGVEKVRAIDLDSIREQFGTVDLIKIDVEGAEVEALDGLDKTITESMPIIIIEVLEKNERNVSEFMDKHGYRLTDRRTIYHLFKPEA